MEEEGETHIEPQLAVSVDSKAALEGVGLVRARVDLRRRPLGKALARRA